MFIGHYGVALAAKRVAPRVSLGVLVAAAQLADLIWPVLLLAGVERIRINPSDNPFLNVTFEWYPWTHSLLAALVWGALAALGYWALRRDRTGSTVVGLVVVSHWVLDWIVHLPDLPLYPGGPVFGLGLWRSPSATVIVECIVFVLGVAVYARCTRAVDRTGTWALLAFVAVLAALYIASIYAPTPTSTDAIAWGALGGWLIPLFGWWVDRHRAPLSTPLADPRPGSRA
jgi:membrane-bound metal-dependent hydrolase YbcI (DUF457 family)